MHNPLVFHHGKMGATLEREVIPLRYTNPMDEYWALAKTAGVADVSHLGRLNITGKDRVAFLNGLLTNDISKLKDDEGAHSVLLNPKARVTADLYVYALSDSFLIDTGEESASKVKEILDRFVITEEVRIEDISNSTVLLTVQGPSSAQVLKEIFKAEVDGLGSLRTKSIGPSLIIVRDRTGRGGFDILIPADEAESVWQNFLLRGEQSVRPVGSEALEILRLEAGIPKYGVDVDEDTIVLEAGYSDAISFTKGCYMGQEVVARATHIGRVNRRLVQLEVDGKETPEPRSPITAESGPAGLITSSRFSPSLAKTIALGYVGRDFASVGTKLRVNVAGTDFPAIVKKLV